jgi:hypothetical protein
MKVPQSHRGPSPLWETVQTATLPVFADNYPSLAHNQSNQKAMPLPIFDN